jgi:hypothetical protein
LDVNAIVADFSKRQAALGSRIVSLAKPAEPPAAPVHGSINGSPESTAQLPPRQMS